MTAQAIPKSAAAALGPWGLPLMKFNLTYEGSLPSSGNKPKNEDKWRIRREIA